MGWLTQHLSQLLSFFFRSGWKAEPCMSQTPFRGGSGWDQITDQRHLLGTGIQNGLSGDSHNVCFLWWVLADPVWPQLLGSLLPPLLPHYCRGAIPSLPTTVGQFRDVFRNRFWETIGFLDFNSLLYKLARVNSLGSGVFDHLSTPFLSLTAHSGCSVSQLFVVSHKPYIKHLSAPHCAECERCFWPPSLHSLSGGSAIIVSRAVLMTWFHMFENPESSLIRHVHVKTKWQMNWEEGVSYVRRSLVYLKFPKGSISICLTHAIWESSDLGSESW
jgi:hypothetical protein